MSILVIGVNHKTASVSLREKVYFSTDKLALYIQDILARGYAEEAVLISTCNRSELYCSSNTPELIREWFSEQTSLSMKELEPALYLYRDEDAVAHIMHVACGLDSMVLGEPQILGQLKEAFSESCTAGGIDGLFHRLFQQVFNLAKEIRTSTAIGACPVSVASAAVHFTKQKITDFSDKQVAVIGAGETTELLLRYLKTQVKKPISIVNRSVEKALSLAEQLGGCVYSLEKIHDALANADLIFTATGSAVPLVTKQLVQRVMETRKNQPLLCLDIAVPRNIESEVAEIADVELFCIDDLMEIIENNRQGREHAAQKARELIHERSLRFIGEFQSHNKVMHTIRAYRNQIEIICQSELIKAKQQLHSGIDPAQVLDEFAYAFTKKLLHTPSVQLRQASVDDRLQLVSVVKQLFAIPDNV